APPIRVKPFHTRDKLEDLELLDFVVEAVNFRLLELDAAPFHCIDFGQCFYDFNDPGAGSNAFFFKLQKRIVSLGASFIRVSKQTCVASATSTRAPRRVTGVVVANTFGFGRYCSGCTLPI